MAYFRKNDTGECRVLYNQSITVRVWISRSCVPFTLNNRFVLLFSISILTNVSVCKFTSLYVIKVYISDVYRFLLLLFNRIYLLESKHLCYFLYFISVGLCFGYVVVNTSPCTKKFLSSLFVKSDFLTRFLFFWNF